MSKSGKPYEEGSIADFAVRGLKKIVELSGSQKISDKLLSFNTLLFALVLTVNVTYFFTKSTTLESFGFLIILAISFVFSLVTVNGYIYILEIFSNIASDKKISALRSSITILFIDLAISVIGLAFNSPLIIYTSLGIIALQLFFIPFIGFFSISKQPIEDREVGPSQLWVTLNKIAITCGIISFIVQIITIILTILKII
jgi:hypothetical protein